MLNASPDLQEFVPYPPAQVAAVRLQMERMLQSQHFCNSRRYPALLRFLVEETLEGRSGFLKERLVGVQVFARPADYDTAADPIVRVTIAEVRKRIAQYYHEDAHASEVRIELTPGRYVPDFLPGKDTEEHRAEAHAAETPVAHANAPVEKLQRRSRWAGKRLWFDLAAFAVVVAASAAGWRWFHPSAIQELWAPFFVEKGPVTFCLPISAKKNGNGAASDTAQAIAHALDLTQTPASTSPTFLEHELLGENVVYSDVLAMLKMEAIAAQQRRPVRLRLSLATTLNDLREGPSVLIGGLDNQWTLQTIAPLRFRFAGSDDDQYWITDAENPAMKDWSLHLKQQYAAVTRDYAIVARVHSEATGQIMILAAGIGMSGTAAAGELLADPKGVEELRRHVGAGFANRDFEAVLSTDVVNGIAGPPKIVATVVF